MQDGEALKQDVLEPNDFQRRRSSEAANVLSIAAVMVTVALTVRRKEVSNTSSRPVWARFANEPGLVCLNPDELAI